MKLIIISFSFLIQQIYSKCAFAVPALGQIPIVPEDDENFYGTTTQCPQYKDTKVCCNSVQDGQLESNFRAIKATFGSQGAGCDICAANLMRFWCEYTCSPNQKDFVNILGEGYVPDPQDITKEVKVQLVEITLQPQLACDVWSSCSRTQFASQVSAMQSPGGFFNFQGENAIAQASQFISSVFSDDINSLALTNISQCDLVLNKTVEVDGKTIYVDPHGFEVYQNCSCNNCDLRCSQEEILYQPTGVMEGFNTTLVLIVWGISIIVTAALTIFRCFQKQQKKRKENLIQGGLQQNLLPGGTQYYLIQGNSQQNYLQNTPQQNYLQDAPQQNLLQGGPQYNLGLQQNKVQPNVYIQN